jgi:hypothetical protein
MQSKDSLDYFVELGVQYFTKVGTLEYNVLHQAFYYTILETPNGSIVVILNGTTTIREQIGNFMLFPLSEDGFPPNWAESAEAIHDKMTELELIADCVIGYSRGGAIALIYAFYNKIQSIAFSPPKVGNKVLEWKVPPLLVFCLDDWVTKVPPNFRHPHNFIARILKYGGHRWKIGKFLKTKERNNNNKLQ